ncbi:neuron navigator 3-like [Asterias rubens]|uniref:neuron navigator 3-like n=1 Tax=Asterias rubens TaxID=7604 RepID=UPI0014555FD4|nr:neuron navigator 3-like [Asterias rubens]
MIENIDKCLQCLAAKGVNTEGLLAKDIREGNLKAVLGLFFSLSRFKQQLQQQQQQQKQTAAAGKQPTSTTHKPTTASTQHKVQSSSQSQQATQRQQPQRQLAAPTTQAGQKRQTASLSHKQSGNLQSQSSAGQRLATPKPQTTPRSSSQVRPPASKSPYSAVPSPYQTGAKAQGKPSGPSTQLGAQQRKAGASTTSLASSRLERSRATSQKSNSSSHRNSSSSDMSSRIPTFNKGPRSTQGSGVPQRGQLEKGRVPSSSASTPTQGAIQTSSTTSSQGTSLPNGASTPSNLQPPTRTASQIRTLTPSASKASSSAQQKQQKQQLKLQQQQQKQQQQQQQQQQQSQQTPKSPNKSSMLTKLKFFGKEHAGKEQNTTPKTNGVPKPATTTINNSSSESTSLTQPPKDAAASRNRTAVQERPAQDKSRTSSSLKKHGSSSSIGTTASNASSSGGGGTGGAAPPAAAQSTPPSPGSSLGSSSPKNALKAVAQKTIGRAFGGGKTKPVTKPAPGKPLKDDLGVRGEPVGSADTPRVETPRSNEANAKASTKSKLSPPGGKPTSIKQIQTAASTKTKLPGPGQGQATIATPGQTPPRGIPKPGSAPAGPKTGLKTPTSYQTLPKISNMNGTKQLEEEGNNASFTRGGAYSTFPGPGNTKQKNGEVTSMTEMRTQDDTASRQPSCKPKNEARSPDTARLPASPSHGAQRSPANTATVAPFNYTGSRPMSKECSELSIASASMSDSSLGTPIQSQNSVSSSNSQSSDNSVVYRPREDGDYCTSVYKNDKVVTTFGTPPTQPRAAKSYSDVRPNNMDLTVMSVQTPPTSRTTKETTFGDSVTTQLRNHRSPTGSSKSNQSPQGSPRTQRSAIATYGASAARLNNLSSLPLQIPSMPVQGDAPYSAYSYRSGGVPQRFVPAPSLTRLYSNSMRRTTSNRSHLSDLQYTEQPILDDDDMYDEDIGSGYVSDGDILHRNAQLSDIASGYMSEGGGFLYAKRLGTGGSRLRDGMAAVREFLQKDVDLSDEESYQTHYCSD